MSMSDYERVVLEKHQASQVAEGPARPDRCYGPQPRQAEEEGRRRVAVADLMERVELLEAA